MIYDRGLCYWRLPDCCCDRGTAFFRRYPGNRRSLWVGIAIGVAADVLLARHPLGRIGTLADGIRTVAAAPLTAPRFPKKIILPASAVRSIATLIAIGATAPPASALTSASTPSMTSTTSITPTLVVVPSVTTPAVTTSPTTPTPATPRPESRTSCDQESDSRASSAAVLKPPVAAPKPPVAAKPAPKPPVAAPRPACDPNYSGCVPIASDVDCEGGGGNGPAYVRGPIRVVGKDIYDLDRQGNRDACQAAAPKPPVAAKPAPKPTVAAPKPACDPNYSGCVPDRQRP